VNLRLRRIIAFVPRLTFYFIGKVGYSLNQVFIPLHNKLYYWERGLKRPIPMFKPMRICPFTRFSKTLKKVKK
jgi:hypothetical protein